MAAREVPSSAKSHVKLYNRALVKTLGITEITPELVDPVSVYEMGWKEAVFSSVAAPNNPS